MSFRTRGRGRNRQVYPINQPSSEPPQTAGSSQEFHESTATEIEAKFDNASSRREQDMLLALANSKEREYDQLSHDASFSVEQRNAFRRRAAEYGRAARNLKEEMTPGRMASFRGQARYQFVDSYAEAERLKLKRDQHGDKGFDSRVSTVVDLKTGKVAAFREGHGFSRPLNEMTDPGWRPYAITSDRTGNRLGTIYAINHETARTLANANFNAPFSVREAR